jgi:hypothetical protein
MGVDLIVFGFSTVNGFHIEGMAEDEGDVVLNAEISDPVPGEHTFYCDHDVLPEGSDDAKKGFRVRVNILMDSDISSGIKDADKHFLGMKVDSTIKLVLLGIKSHMGFLLSMVDGL